ncbi:glycosyltransferase family 2 protein [Ruegeria lacuscaerulensis]|uniref:glycosyltransferase family 2 protein n=1 Tax=Ruegeria lacuscaerulensis TaxID=55218 RepID=UPI00148158F3|nr:glycosyltransferase family 2 protein [Ruegeria lacuscaerulensis]
MGDSIPSWGIVSTVRGSALDILRFAAYHLDLGVDRMHLYLDEPNPKAFNTLNRHPKIEVRNCDDGFWANRKRERPEKHQTRQTANATFTYRKTDLDWLVHIDVDEFLWSERPIVQHLAEVPDHIPVVRVRPIEAMAGGADLYKAYIPASQNREAIVQAVYQNYGAFVKCGFLSHVQGKVFARTGLPRISYRIHSLFQNGERLPRKAELSGVDLCHRHAPDWEHWRAHFQFRLERGSYQAGMSPNVPRELGGMNMNELLSWIEAEEGTAGLRAFFNEMSGSTPDVRARLEQHGMIRHRPLDLDQKLRKHFPGSI